MISDKLTIDQRIRLEAIAQAQTTTSICASISHNVQCDADNVIEIAKKYENYIRMGVANV